MRATIAFTLLTLVACGEPSMSDLFENQLQNNIGGTADAVAAGAAAVGVAGRGPPATLVQFQGDDNDPQVVTVGIYATSVSQGGPIVGIVNWGSGGSGQNEVEVDVLEGFGFDVAQQTGGGVLLSVVASRVVVTVRNDSNVIPRNVAGESAIGGGLTQTIQVHGNLGIGSRASTNGIIRTRQVVLNAGGNGLAPLAVVQQLIPRFATAYRVVRNSAAQSITVQTDGNAPNQTDGPYAVAANQPAPVLDIPAGARFVTITNTGAAALPYVAVMFEIGL